MGRGMTQQWEGVDWARGGGARGEVGLRLLNTLKVGLYCFFPAQRRMFAGFIIQS